MPIFPLAVQNAVPYEIVGVASAAESVFPVYGRRTRLGSIRCSAGESVCAVVSGGAPVAHPASDFPPSALERIDNPQALFNPEIATAIQQAIAIPGAPGRAAAQQVLAAIRAALATSLQDVFVASTCMMIAATLILLLLKDIPLRRSNRTAPGTAKL